MTLNTTSRRAFLRGAALAGATLGAAGVSAAALAGLPEVVSTDKPATQPPLTPNTGRPYNPVVTLNGWTLPWRMNAG
ncbi:MAG: copper oxidase, partial [Betaproteobacteria bacterium]|nr:copper oxidase [Betaproteobacteria bacterium]